MDGAILTPNELVFTFGVLHLCVQFGENRQRNATVRVTTHGQTDTQTDRQMQTDFIICPMLYAIAMGQIINLPRLAKKTKTKLMSRRKTVRLGVREISPVSKGGNVTAAYQVTLCDPI